MQDGKQPKIYQFSYINQHHKNHKLCSHPKLPNPKPHVAHEKVINIQSINVSKYNLWKLSSRKI